MNLPLYIARKLYGGESVTKNVSRPAIRIATLGVAIGLAVVIVSVSVVLGFKHTIRDKVVGFGSHITVANFITLQTSKTAPIVVDDAMMKRMKSIEGVNHVQRYSFTQGILKTDADFLGVTLKGVDEDFDTTFIAQNMVEGSMPSFSRDKSSNKILVSKTIADKLSIKSGDRVFAYFLTGVEDVRARRFTVAGIYQTNLSKYDNITVFADLSTVTKLNGWEKGQVMGAEMQITDFDELDKVEDVVIDKINKTVDPKGETFTSATVRDQAPQLFSWLDLLDLNVWIIMILMVCVAGFTIVSGLLIIILERTSMIGVLKALGARNDMVRHTFLWLAMFIVGKGVVWGNILGVGICVIQYFTGIIKLDATIYYVDTVPVEFNLPIWVIINVATILVSAMILVLPSFFVSNIHPAKSMRYE